jgi:hypothetical protein
MVMERYLVGQQSLDAHVAVAATGTTYASGSLKQVWARAVEHFRR